MIELIQNPDGSFSHGRKHTDAELREEIDKRVARAEHMARYGANPNEIKKFWNANVDWLYLSLDDPDKKHISKAFLEGVLDMTPEGQEKKEIQKEEYEAYRKKNPVVKVAKAVPRRKVEPMKKKAEPIVVKNIDEFKKALLSVGLSEADAAKQAALKKNVAVFKAGLTFKISHDPKSGYPFSMTQIMKE